MLGYAIRAATESDLEAILELARFLNTVNLPYDRDALTQILKLSEESFSGKVKDSKKREYLFVLRDTTRDRVIGTSMIIGQLGRKEAPYIYFDVKHDERYSATLDRHFRHTLLRIGYSFNGPTEIGGLVLHPEYRRSPERLGMLLSYVRFLFIKAKRSEFRDELLAELLPPLEPGGTSHLWEAIGRHFTGLTYREADHLSKQNKEFIRTLFPEGDIYASVLATEAQEVIGKVGDQSKGVEKILTRIGFEYVDRVDPFDGGPHFAAATDEVSPVKHAFEASFRPSRASSATGALVANPIMAFIATVKHQSPYFHAVLDHIAIGTQDERDSIYLQPTTADALSVEPGDRVWVLPLS